MATQRRLSVARKSLSEQKLWEDEVLREVYATRDAYAAEHGYDLDRIYADLKNLEAKSRLRRVNERPLTRVATALRVGMGSVAYGPRGIYPHSHVHALSEADQGRFEDRSNGNERGHGADDAGAGRCRRAGRSARPLDRSSIQRQREKLADVVSLRVLRGAAAEAHAKLAGGAQ